MQPDRQAIDTGACEAENIHLIESVQPHGALLALAELSLEILQASDNASAILRCWPVEVVGRIASSLFDDSSIAAIKQILDTRSDDIWPAVPCSINLRDSEVKLQGELHRYRGSCILELEPESATGAADLQALKKWISIDFPKLFKGTTKSDLFANALTAVQSMCDFDRVLIYQFDADANGSVVAEKKRGSYESFIGHKFPASDIPAQARNLYLKKTLRILVDVNAVSSSISPTTNPLTGTSLDLTYSTLRSMSPIHVEYLMNMGVVASMSISLVVADKLWGLIVCHHKIPKAVDFATRSKCDLVAKVVSGLIDELQKHEVTSEKLKLTTQLDKIVDRLSRTDNLAQSIALELPTLVTITNAAGIALVGEDWLELYGMTPEKDTVLQMFSWLRDTKASQLLSSDRLSIDYPQWKRAAARASGLIAIDISVPNPLWLLWFRPEQIEEIAWAGNPYKPAEVDTAHSNQPLIHPRKSFELWAETVHARSHPWKAFELEAAGSVQKHIFMLKLSEMLRAEKIEKALRQQREDVLALLTHDLRIPIIGMERLIQNLLAGGCEKVPQSLRETLQVMRDANNQQRERVYKLMQVLNYELGKVGLLAEEIDCEKLIQSSIAQLILMPEESDTTTKIVTQINQNDHSFRSDRKSLERLVLNLLDNALKAVDGGGIINVTCECTSERLNVEVQDSGPGIASEDRVRLFDRFWQGGVKQPYSAHVGMGLYFCKRIVDILNGTISCESEPGKGTIFKASIPSL